MKRALWLQVVAVAGVATGCQGTDPDIEVSFAVTDHDGRPLSALISCGGERRVELEYYDDYLEVAGEVVYEGAGDYTCLLASDLRGLWVDVQREGGSVYLGGWEHRPAPPLRMWRPEVTITQVDDQVVVGWDPPAPPPPVDLEWRASQYLDVPGQTVRLQLEVGTTEVSIPLAAFDGIPAPELRLSATHGYSPWDAYILYDPPPIPVVLAPPAGAPGLP